MSDEPSDAAADPQSSRSAPPAEVLRRAISHVESLLERLEGPAADVEAARVRQEAQSDAAAIIRAAEEEADRIRSEAASDAASELESALHEADRIRAQATRPTDEQKRASK